MATNKVVVAGSSVTAPQLSDLFRQIGDGSVTGEHIQALLEHRNPFEFPMDTESQLERWRRLLYETFGILLGEMEIPEQKPGFDRLIVVPQGLTLNQVVEAFRTEFKVFLYVEDLDLDSAVTENERDAASGTYAIWVRDRVEADEENANKSANKIKTEGLTTETLMERLLHELIYYSECKKHLDIKNLTLCAGSRRSGDGVPGVDWDSSTRRLNVSWCHPDHAYSSTRAREVEVVF